ncbi:protein FAM162B isoform X2 [Felis catus]|uniref:protein FAM162B isoform X2 n=1 Tax=Felis catus TaxID=9685 RepID=UPI001D1A0D57|nr:protein FAM162B isoform X2 [Felis catus]
MATRFYSVRRNAFKRSCRQQSQEVVNLLREFSSRGRPPPGPRPGGNRPPQGRGTPVRGRRPGGGDRERVCACQRLQLRPGVSPGSDAGRGGPGRAAELSSPPPAAGSAGRGAACSRLSGPPCASVWGASSVAPRERTEKPRGGPSRLRGLGVCPATVAAVPPAALGPKGRCTGSPPSTSLRNSTRKSCCGPDVSKRWRTSRLGSQLN